MWKVVHIAPNHGQAETLKNTLESEGFLAKIRPVRSAAQGDGNYEILVPDSEVYEAYEVLCEQRIK